MSRHMAFEGVDNFRDYGDYGARGGRRLKAGYLYRSAAHGRATPGDLEAIAALNLAVIVDLRRKGERLRDPSLRHSEFAGRVIDNDLGEEHEDGWHTHIRNSDLTETSFHDYMLAYYRDAPFQVRHIDLYARYFQALAHTDGPILIHCAAGKDRTGILAALTHHLAGVHPDDITADYLLTNNPERMALRLPLVAQAIQEIAGRVPSEAALRVAMGVEAVYLNTAFEAIEAGHGGPDRYLEQVLGVDARTREAIMERLLV